MEFVKTWHIMHLIISFLTGGWWVPVWIVVALRNNQKNKQMEFNHNMRNRY